ncbi:SOS response-associated peptidase [Mycolicibacter hiberniae]|uniref:Abasic site processing protein n=1 Tax=Mycolicibacter hiberniae TaxID=29314 RepID=A0A7I7X3Q4_9MYCO|nr:SOS response-associated peptidase [Mycolicibacter hiberniae]MCV7088200.1 SOS response-associated peptidase [Mycolicibacter hiberniae]ORV72507.1 hypothetical protein AWC09_03840 [Mycolicibacter hiberniae]BBZ23950.1 DUF159 family protein [Mycolicibacter hiberniae]
MCGRFAVTTDPAMLAERIGAINEIPAERYAGPNYNVAPTDDVIAVVCRHGEPGDRPTRRLRQMRWGLVPPWTRAGADGRPAPGGRLLINARADKVATAPAFRAAADHRRCLVPMDGYYEWRTESGGPAGRKARKTPFYIHGDGATLFAAGLWSVWRPHKTSEPVLSLAVITTDSVGDLAGIHDRMPVLLAQSHWDRWLDPDSAIDTGLLTCGLEAPRTVLRQVSPLVNSVANNSPDLIAPAAPQPEQGYLL